MGENSTFQLWSLLSFHPVLTSKRPGKDFKILENLVIFFIGKRTLLAKGAPDGQINFFLIGAGETSFWAMRVVDT